MGRIINRVLTTFGLILIAPMFIGEFLINTLLLIFNLIRHGKARIN